MIYPEHFNFNAESIKMTLPSFCLHMAFLFSFYLSSGNSYCSTAAEGQNELIEFNKTDGLQLSNQSNVELLCILLQVCFPHLLSFPLILLFCQRPLPPDQLHTPHVGFHFQIKCLHVLLFFKEKLVASFFHCCVKLF